MSDENNKTFIKITNNDIYQMLLKIDKKQDYTNGKIRFHRGWLIGVSFLLIALITAVMS